jgi:hypothetical protein
MFYDWPGKNNARAENPFKIFNLDVKFTFFHAQKMNQFIFDEWTIERKKEKIVP